jgi:hypothetical protein
MNPIPSSFLRRPATWWTVLTILLLVVWPVFSHVRWLKPFWPLHGLPAFFLGLVVLVMVAAVVRLAAGAFAKGPRWLGSREAFRLVLVAGALVVSTVVLFYSVELWRGKRAWAEVAREAGRRGESLELRSLVPPPVLPDQDFANAPLFGPLFRARSVVRDGAGNLIAPNLGPLTNILQVGLGSPVVREGVPLASWMAGQPTELGVWLEAIRPRRTAGAPPEEAPAIAAAILEALAPFDGAIEELRAYSGRPYCRLPFDYAFPCFSESHADRVLTSFVRLLRLRASAALVLGRDDAAFQDLRLTLRLLDYQRQQPTLYYQDMRAYAVADGLQPLWEGLQARRWTAGQLEALQQALQDFNPLEDFAARARLVALANAAFVEAIIPTMSPASEPWSGFHPQARQTLRWTRWFYPVGWSLQDQAAIGRLWLQHSESPTSGWAHPLRSDSETGLSHELLRGSSDPFFATFLVPRVAMMNWELRETLPFGQTVAHLAMLACALERQRLLTGTRPETLAGLVPGVLGESPVDPMNGRAFGYRPVAGQGFVLYSVGSNGTDEQGEPCPRRVNWRGEPEAWFRLDQNDWVWRSGTSATDVAH